MVVRRVMRSSTKAARILGEQIGPPPMPAADLPDCPLCGRPLIAGPTIDEHHLLPRSRGGKEKFLIHKICHQKIHRALTEKDLERHYRDWASLRAHPQIALFIQWVRRRPPTFMG